MDEAVWDRCEDVRSLLAAFGKDWKRPADENWFVIRKARLFFCALMRRRAWRILHVQWRRFVGHIEKFADRPPIFFCSVAFLRESGVLTEKEFTDFRPLYDALRTSSEFLEVIADDRMNDPQQQSILRQICRGMWLLPWTPDGLFWDVATTVERYCNREGLRNDVRIVEGSEATADVIRCVLGNPFRPPLIPDSRFLTWNHGVVTSMAGAIYKGRRFREMPVLGDALEDSGCEDAHVLGHCRDASSHWRGCWVLDMLRPPAVPTAKRTGIARRSTKLLRPKGRGSEGVG